MIVNCITGEEAKAERGREEEKVRSREGEGGAGVEEATERRTEGEIHCTRQTE